MEQQDKSAQQRLRELVAGSAQSLEGFISLGQGLGKKMDYSLESLNEVEDLLVAFRNRENVGQLQADAWLYIGQSICKTFGGRWKVSDDVRNYRQHYGLPVVHEFSKFDDEYCPMTEIKLFLGQDARDFFRTRIEGLRAGTLRYR